MNIIKNKTCSILVDAQKTFTPLCSNELPVPEGDEIVDECLKTFNKTGYKIVSKDAHTYSARWISFNPNDIGKPIPNCTKQIDKYWTPHAIVGSYGFELLDGLPSMEEFDFIVYKGLEKNIHPYSMAYHLLNPNSKGNKISTGVIEFLNSKGITTVIILGLATNYCCMATAIDLKLAGFIVIMNLGGSRGIGDITHAINTMKEYGVEFINSSDELVVS